MHRALVRFVLVSAGILSLGIMAPATRAGTVVRFDLNYSVDGSNGPIDYFDIELFDDEAPITVANFLQYVNNGLYNNTIIHRDIADFIVQGGGFTTNLDPITTYDPIQNEFSPTRSNVTGTVAMAKLGGDPNSATSQWFVNLVDNSGNLDNQNGGFTVFGKVLGDGMTLINAVSSLPTYDLSQQAGSAFTDVPMFNDGASFVTVTSASVIPPSPVGLSGFVYVDVNKNGIMDGDDYAIAGAPVSLIQTGSSTPLATVYSASDGSYQFSALSAGTFSVQIGSSGYAAGQDNGTAQMVLDKDGNIVSTGTAGTLARNAYNNIALDAGQTGVNFNLAEAAYPVALMSARLLMNVPEVPPHTSGTPILTSNAGTASPLDFGTVLVGASSTQTLTVSNAGSQGSAISGTLPTARGVFAPDGDPAFGPLSPGDSASQEYVYTPTARGDDTQDVSVVTDAGNLPVTFTGTGVAPVASVGQTDGNYALVRQTNSAVITVTNLGDGNLSGLGDQSNLHGSIAASSGVFAGDGGDFNLADAGSKPFEYSYTPTVRGTQSTTVTASFDNGNPDGTNTLYSQQVTISGTGVAPVQSVDTSAADAGRVRIGTTGTASITIRNVGDGNLSGLGDVSNLAGTISAGTGAFAGAEGAINLTDSASHAFSYSYAPTAHAPDSAAITVAFTNGNEDGTNNAQTVSAQLIGQGVGPVFSSDLLPASTLDFGTTSGTPTSLTLGISNDSTDDAGGNATLIDLTLLSAAISGTDADYFSVADFVDGTVLHAGYSLPMEIGYNGDVGERLATLTITTDQNAAFGAAGDTFVYTLSANHAPIVVVPEPSTITLFGVAAIGLIAFLGFRRRRGPHVAT